MSTDAGVRPLPGEGRRPMADADLSLAIGRRIRRLRLELGMTQDDLAGRIGVLNNKVCLWECGRNAPSPPLVAPLCRALGITPNDLFGWEDETP